MEIIAHRGYWREKEEGNKLESLKAALDKGYGVETDIRDFNGTLVISHDMASKEAIRLEKLLEYYMFIKSKNSLALNVKADGIQALVVDLFNKYDICNYFLFDMSVPEMVVNKKVRITYYTRQSDIESQMVLYDGAKGVWIDSFFDERWIDMNAIKEQLLKGKDICLVSPELHGRNHENLWEKIIENKLNLYDNFLICTDKPNQAKEFFYV